MEYLIFFSLIFATMINFTMGAIGYSGVNRTFLTMYRGLLESSVVVVDEHDVIVEPYFKKDVLEKYVANYFEENLTRYVTHYKASIYYINEEDESICTSRYCQAVKISLECDINYLFHYKKGKIYYINQNYERETQILH